MKDIEFAQSIDAKTISKLELKQGAKASVFIFSIAILMIVFAGAFPQYLTHFEPGDKSFTIAADGSLTMVAVISSIALSASAMMMMITKTSALDVTKVSLFTSMGTAVVSVFGVVWMSSTFMNHHQELIKEVTGELVYTHPWTFALVVFILGVLMFSQAATTKAIMPLGLALGIPPYALIAIFPAVNSDFVLPGYPTLLAAIDFDTTGSTKIGNYVINHSFLVPGVVAISVAIAVGFLLVAFLI